VISVLNAFGFGALAQTGLHVEPSMRAALVAIGSAATLHGFVFVAIISAAGAAFGALLVFFTVGRPGKSR
jgi:hypothetical protein